jgi:hypothetical protein
MRERRQTPPALFLTKKKVGLFLDTATCRFAAEPYFVVAKRSQLFVSIGRHFLEKPSIRTRGRKDLA